MVPVDSRMHSNNSLFLVSIVTGCKNSFMSMMAGFI